MDHAVQEVNEVFLDTKPILFVDEVWALLIIANIFPFFYNVLKYFI